MEIQGFRAFYQQHAGEDVNKTLLHYEEPGKLYVICTLLLDVLYVPAYVLGGFSDRRKGSWSERRRSKTDKVVDTAAKIW